MARAIRPRVATQARSAGSSRRIDPADPGKF
jgi:hypothetical protein